MTQSIACLVDGKSVLTRSIQVLIKISGIVKEFVVVRHFSKDGSRRTKFCETSSPIPFDREANTQLEVLKVKLRSGQTFSIDFSGGSMGTTNLVY